MTIEDFRTIALSMPEADEGAHSGHPDFRVLGKIFASLSFPDKGMGMVKLSPEEQGRLVKTFPETFAPAPGAWGVRGATYVRLETVDAKALRKAIVAAWRNTAPKHLVEERGRSIGA